MPHVPESRLEGDCFVVALAIFSSPAASMADVNTRLVHGLPVGTGTLNLGLRYWHAWVELDHPDHGWLVLDWSNGKQHNIVREAYYQAAQLTERHVWRYTDVMVDRMRFKHHTCGPWVPGWEDMEDLPPELSTALRPPLEVP